MNDPRQGPSILPYAAASASACACVLLAAFFMPAASRQPAVFGAAASSLGALCALSALAGSAAKGTNGVLAGFSIGFLARALLVAVGLLASGARGDAALTYVFTFFGLYAVTQLVEIVFVHNGSRRVSSGSTPGATP